MDGTIKESETKGEERFQDCQNNTMMKVKKASLHNKHLSTSKMDRKAAIKSRDEDMAGQGKDSEASIRHRTEVKGPEVQRMVGLWKVFRFGLEMFPQNSWAKGLDANPWVFRGGNGP